MRIGPAESAPSPQSARPAAEAGAVKSGAASSAAPATPAARGVEISAHAQLAADAAALLDADEAPRPDAVARARAALANWKSLSPAQADVIARRLLDS